MDNYIIRAFSYIMNKLAEGTFSIVYLGPNKTVFKQYKVPQALYREIQIMDMCKDTQFILQPISKESNQLILPLMVPLSNLDINVLRQKDHHRIITSMINGLKELHKRQIIHHDIKSDNILYNPIDLSIKIADFSSSFTVNEFQNLDKTILNNTTSPLHAFYRKIENEEDLYQSDKWSLVVTIYRMYVPGFTKIKSPKHLIKAFNELRDKYPSDARIFDLVQRELFKFE